MEKSIHIVEVSNIYGNTLEIKKRSFLFNHLLDNILLIQDILYSIYFVYNKESNNIFIYLLNNLCFQNFDSKDEDNTINYTLSKKDLKNLIINSNIENFKNIIILQKIFNHFLNYDYNLWNDVNDWLNNNLNFTHFKYHLLFVKINSLIPFSKK